MLFGRTPGGDILKMQRGDFATGTLAANVGTFVTVPLTFPWPTAHVLFVCEFQAISSATGCTKNQSMPFNLANGQVVINNSGTAQQFLVRWISYGY